MHKKTSDHLQSRAVRAVLDSTANDVIDETAFIDEASPLREVSYAKQRAALRALPDREALVAQKLRLQTRIAEARATLSYERSRLPHAQRSDPRRWLAPYYAELDRLALQLKRTDLALAETKKNLGMQSCTLSRHETRERKEAKQAEFYEAFFLMARTMLAGPVFDRVLAAAQHRIDEK
jgi:hypothetical protein